MKLLGVAASLLCCLSLGLQCKSAELTSDQALEQLKQGNQRYMDGRSIHPRIDPDRRVQTATQGQQPIAAILGCSDSRVPPEIIFDTAFAELFVVRIAGNICDTSESGSLEYAVSVLQTPLIVVLGHQQCGAVQAAVDGKDVPGNIAKIVQKIKPAVKEACQGTTGANECLRLSIQHNVWHSISDLFQQSELVRERVASGKLKVVGAIRDLRYGHIDWLGQHPLQDELLKGAPNAVPASSIH